MGIDIVIEWLLQPISGSLTHSISVEHQWHARLMTLSWGVMIPAGVLIARYFKITRHQQWPAQLDSHFWWYSHLFFQITGCCIALAALVLVADLQSPEEAGVAVLLHELFGWSVMALAAA